MISGGIEVTSFAQIRLLLEAIFRDDIKMIRGLAKFQIA